MKKVPLSTASIGAAILVTSNKWGEVTIGARIADKMAEKKVFYAKWSLEVSKQFSVCVGYAESVLRDAALCSAKG